MLVNLTAGETYYLKATSKAELTGDLTAYVKISNTASTISMTGKFSNSSGEKVSIVIYDN